LVAGIIAFAVLVRLAYLLADCPLELAADEAHYWDWSRRIDWSYYSKGPLVAWMIRLSCELFGGVSDRLVGSPMLAVRLPALLCHGALLTAGYVLTMQVTRCKRKALATLAVGLSLPIIEAGGTLMTIDAPFTCCWAWALVFGHAAIIRGRAWAWPALGLAVGLGILAKYTMAIWLPCAACFLLTCRTYRHIALSSGFWLACCIAAFCCSPILIWNVQHDWITLRHVGTQAGGEADQWRWLGPLRYVAEQAGVLLVYWFIAWARSIWANRPGRARDPGRLYLWWLSAPVFALFLVASLRTPGQINWPIAAYVGGLVLAVDWAFTHWRQSGENLRKLTSTSLVFASVIGLVITLITHYPQLARPIFLAVGGEPTAGHPLPLRRYDPTARLRGWRHLAAAVDELRASLWAEGDDPIIATAFWSLPAELGIYCAGHPDVFCFGAALQQRLSQYDLWQPNPTWNPELFVGKTLIYVGDVAPEVAAAFERMEHTQRVEYSEGGHPLVYWNVTVGRGFRGFGSPEKWPGHRRY
jgi:hypothetical protein